MKSKKELTDLILESMREEVSQFIETEGKITSSTEYEERVLELSKKFAREIVLRSAGELPKSRNLKKSLDKSGSARIK